MSENSPRTEMEGGLEESVTQETIRTQTSACKKQKERRKEEGKKKVAGQRRPEDHNMERTGDCSKIEEQRG